MGLFVYDHSNDLVLPVFQPTKDGLIKLCLHCGVAESLKRRTVVHHFLTVKDHGVGFPRFSGHEKCREAVH